MTNALTTCPTCQGTNGHEPGCPDNDPAYLLYCEEEEAIHYGLATALTDCYLCPEGSPRRGILSTSIGGDRNDPSEVQHLSCGHEII